MPSLMYSLVGEQPIPNLLPVRFLKPDATVLIHTERTKPVSLRLQDLMPHAQRLPVDAYDIVRIEQAIRENLAIQRQTYEQVTINLTGGTKAMAIAAYRLAEQLSLPFVYFQSEGRRSLLHRYAWDDERKPVLFQQDDMPGIISIEDYVRAHVGSFIVRDPSTNAGGAFETALGDTLRGCVDEVTLGVQLSGALDADLMIRRGNHVAVIEAKTGRKARSKDGIDQLNSIASPQYFGTFTTKFLALDQQWDHTLSNLRDLAEARNIILLELPSYNATKMFTQDEIRHVYEMINKKL